MPWLQANSRRRIPNDRRVEVSGLRDFVRAGKPHQKNYFSKQPTIRSRLGSCHPCRRIFSSFRNNFPSICHWDNVLSMGNGRWCILCSHRTDPAVHPACVLRVESILWQGLGPHYFQLVVAHRNTGWGAINSRSRSFHVN